MEQRQASEVVEGEKVKKKQWARAVERMEDDHDGSNEENMVDIQIAARR